jgi:hypothetical protein
MLNGFQKGSIFGAVLVALAFAFALSLTSPIRSSLISGDSLATIQTRSRDGTWKTNPVPNLSIDKGDKVFFRIIIKYSGPFSKGHETEATWIYDPFFLKFIPWGGKKYNYTT